MERRVNIAVGIFLVLGVLALAYLSIKLGRVSLFGSSGYVVSVDFPSVGGLKAGSSVEIAGVEIGRVESIGLADYQARVTVRLNRDIKLQEDSIASIKKMLASQVRNDQLSIVLALEGRRSSKILRSKSEPQEKVIGGTKRVTVIVAR